MKQRKFRLKFENHTRYNYRLDWIVFDYTVYKVQMKLFPGLWITVRQFSSKTDGDWAAEASAENLLDALKKEGL